MRRHKEGADERGARRQTERGERNKPAAQTAPKYFFALDRNSSGVAATAAGALDPAPFGSGGGGGLPEEEGGGGGGTFLPEAPVAGASEGEDAGAAASLGFSPAGLRNSRFGASFFGGGATLEKRRGSTEVKEHSVRGLRRQSLVCMCVLCVHCCVCIGALRVLCFLTLSSCSPHASS